MRLRIVHVVPYFAPAWSYGGIPRLVYELAMAQAKEHIVSVITTDVLDAKNRHPAGGGTISWQGGNLTAFYLKNISNSLAYNHQLFLPVGLKSALDKALSDADILHIHGHRHLLELMSVLMAKRRNLPYVITANGTAPRIERRQNVKAFLDWVIMDDTIARASACIAVSRAEIEQYIEQGVKRERIYLIPNGLDTQAFLDLPHKGEFRKKWNIPEVPVVLYLGKITPRKGVEYLVRAFDLLRREMDLRLVIAGNDMGFFSEVRREVASRKLEDLVVFTGFVEGREKLSAYVDASVTVYPSQYEIFGLVPFESLLCGTPVIVSDDCGCGEIIGENNLGETVPYGDVQSLARAIKRVINEPESATEKVRRGKEFIKEKLDWKVVAEDTIRLYLKLLGEVE